jgi:L-aminoadipate-semialdehyde dehydrogenase
VTNLDDYLARLIKGCIQLGKAPAMRNILNACPVDYVSRAIVAIAAKGKASVGKSYHFYPPTTQRFSDLFDGVIAAGYAVEYVDYLDWRDDLMALTLSDGEKSAGGEGSKAEETNALYPLLHFVLDDLPSSSRTPVLDTAQLRAEIEGSGITFASVADLMPTYIKYLVSVGFIGEPGADQRSSPAGPSAVTRNNRL